MSNVSLWSVDTDVLVVEPVYNKMVHYAYNHFTRSSLNVIDAISEHDSLMRDTGASNMPRELLAQ